MYKILAICGEAGTGKDTLFQHSLERLPQDMVHEIISCTTRPIREGEAEGINYYYLTPEQFTHKVLNNEMLEATCFNNWFYGTSYDSLRLNKLNIGVFNPDGVRALLDNPNVKLKVIRVICPDKISLLRQINREENQVVDAVLWRYKADKEDFFDLEFNYTEIPNEYSSDILTGTINICELAQDFWESEDKKG